MMDRNIKSAHLLKWGTLLLAVLLSPCTFWGQCGEIETLDYTETPGGNGLFTGQSIELASNGYVQSVTLSVCTGTESQLVIRAYQGEEVIGMQEPFWEVPTNPTPHPGARPTACQARTGLHITRPGRSPSRTWPLRVELPTSFV